jgi:hypothetical protein
MQKHRQPESLRLLYVTADNFPEGIGTAFEKLESLIDDVHNRTFWGLSKPQKGQMVYRAGIAEAYPGEAEKLGCAVYILPAGTYLTQTVTHFRQNLPAIGTAFQQLLSAPDLDEAAWCVEWYKGCDVLCMVKMKD